MKKRCSLNRFIFVFVLVIVLSTVCSFVVFSQTLIGMINDIPSQEELKISIMNNNPDCEGTCTKTINANGYFQTDLSYKVNDTLTIYTYYKDVLNTNTEVATELPYDIRLSICDPPSRPMLYELKTIHDTKAELSWLAEDAVYTALSVDGGNFYETESPKLEENLKSGIHTWIVKACNDRCCAKEVSSSFEIINEAPKAPTFEITEKGLQMKKGTDTDSDPTYVEYKINDGQPIRGETFDINNIQISARTCDLVSCSDWITKEVNSCAQNGVLPFGGFGGNTNGTTEGASNYTAFMDDLKSMLKTETKLNLKEDTACLDQMSTGIEGIKK
ncbi:MAG: hypothetical protein WC755_05240 [Candidatus Woesearchaeota archaeon]